MQKAIEQKNWAKGKNKILRYGEGGFFFDLDACWNVLPRRAILYHKLKDRGVRIITCIPELSGAADKFKKFNSAMCRVLDLLYGSRDCAIIAPK